MQAVMSLLTRTFLLLKSLWATAGFMSSVPLDGSSSCRCARPDAIEYAMEDSSLNDTVFDFRKSQREPEKA